MTSGRKLARLWREMGAAPPAAGLLSSDLFERLPLFKWALSLFKWALSLFISERLLFHYPFIDNRAGYENG